MFVLIESPTTQLVTASLSNQIYYHTNAVHKCFQPDLLDVHRLAVVVGIMQSPELQS